MSPYFYGRGFVKLEEISEIVGLRLFAPLNCTAIAMTQKSLIFSRFHITVFSQSALI